MIRYERTEIGRGVKLLTMLLPLALLISLAPLLLEVISGKSHPGILAVLVVPLTVMAIALPGISKLSVRLVDETLEIRMGVFSRKISLRDVKALSVIDVPWYAGWGVRYSLTGGGELWRVSGTRAVKLELRSGSNFSLGLDDPESLERAIQNLLERSPD